MKSSKLKIQSSKGFACCLLLIACALLLNSCASQKVGKPAQLGYRRALERWTKEGKVYKDFETKFLIKATFKTEEFRESYVREYSAVYMLDSEKTDKLAGGEAEAAQKYHEFFISLHTPIMEWSDLERKEPIWALYLVNDAGERVSPLEIKKVKDRGPNVTRFYPQFDEWSSGYTVKFPSSLVDQRQLITEDTKYVKLIMAGSPGKIELLWTMNR